MAKRKQFNSLTQAANELNIPLNHLTTIKEIYKDGFASNGNVYAKEVAEFYEKNKAIIIAKESESHDDLRTQKLRNEVIIQELKIAELKQEQVKFVEVLEWAKSFGIQLDSVLKAKLIKELPPRGKGLSEEDLSKLCKEYCNSLSELILKNVKKWAKVDDKETTD